MTTTFTGFSPEKPCFFESREVGSATACNSNALIPAIYAPAYFCLSGTARFSLFKQLELCHIVQTEFSLTTPALYAGTCEASRLSVVSDLCFIAYSLTPEQCLIALNEAIHEQAF